MKTIPLPLDLSLSLSNSTSQWEEVITNQEDRAREGVNQERKEKKERKEDLEVNIKPTSTPRNDQ